MTEQFSNAWTAEIERLKAENKRLREALQTLTYSPFYRVANIAQEALTERPSPGVPQTDGTIQPQT